MTSAQSNQPLFGMTRTEIRPRHALITPDGFVPSFIPGWEASVNHIVISGGIGARLNMWFANFETAGSGGNLTRERSTFIYLLEGEALIQGEAMTSGGYAYVPPFSEIKVEAQAGARLLFFEKTWQPLDGGEPPAQRTGREQEVDGFPFLGNQGAMLQTLLPDTPEFDLAVNRFTYQPGATLPFVETHIMEHGMMITSGQGVYRMDDRWYPVKAGDVIWMAPWCPQWYVSMGDEPSSYIYYKDVNRHPEIG